MCIAHVVASVGSTSLDSRLQCRNDAYLDAIGEAVHALCSSIPNGSVVFLPSYGLLDKLVARLQLNGRFSALTTERQVFVEERGESGARVLATYRAAAVKGPAIMFAVMRGKVAEGVDLR